MKYLLLPVFLLFSYPFFAQTPLCPNGINKDDADQLKSIYLSTDGANWSNNKNWNDLTTTEWSGVRWKTIGGECRVDSLVMPGFYLNGKLPSNLQLPHLRFLWFSTNRLSGEIPDFDLPSLEVLRLASNNLTGTIPAFSKLKNLTYLDLSYNQFEGKIPLFDLPKLKILKLFACGLKGSIPQWNLPSLETLDLGCNDLDSLPEYGLILPKITSIIIAHNTRIRANIGVFAQFSTLKSINISFAQQISLLLQGKVQNNVESISVEGIKKQQNFPTATFPNLVSLNLTNSKFDFDENATPLQSLKNLTASYNIQKTFYPVAIFPNLKYLKIENSDFGKSLNFIEQLPKLEQLYANNCKFEVFDFTTKSNTYALKELHLERNKLQGDMLVLRNFPKLESVCFSYNGFSKISKEINLPLIKSIDVQSNKLVFGDLDSLKIPNKVSFLYGFQSNIDIFSVKKFGGVEYLSTKTGNPNKNTYKWIMKYQNSNIFDFAINRFRNDSILVPWQSATYFCEVKNSKYPNLVLLSNAYNFQADNAAEQSYDFLFYPNPCRDVLNIHFFNPVPSSATLTFYDSKGEYVLKNVFRTPLLEEKIDITQLPKGVYIVRIETTRGMKTKKIVVE